MAKYKFPNNFFWGASTSSHQIEGGNDNDWTEWENAGNVKNKDVSGKASDSWNRYEEDFDILEQLNLNSYRFSIEWSRIEPKKGEFDSEALERYKQMILSLKKRDIVPIVTLHHFTNPKWLNNWTDKDNAVFFNNYVEHVVSELSDEVEFWITINEPNNLILMAYASKFWPPQLDSPKMAYSALKVLATAHINAYNTIHRIYKEKNLSAPKVSVALQLNTFEPASSNPLDSIVNKGIKKYRNYYYINKVKNHLDFLGLNYYFSFKVKWNSVESFTNIFLPIEGLDQNDLGWNMDPKGLYKLLIELKELDIPIIITENGIPDEKDEKRSKFIKDHLESVARAIDEGVDVFGYLHWSLLDNFEWADGYTGRFGLVEVNFENQERTVRDSAKVYAEIAESNELEVDE